MLNVHQKTKCSNVKLDVYFRFVEGQEQWPHGGLSCVGQQASAMGGLNLLIVWSLVYFSGFWNYWIIHTPIKSAKRTPWWLEGQLNRHWKQLSYSVLTRGELQAEIRFAAADTFEMSLGQKMNRESFTSSLVLISERRLLFGSIDVKAISRVHRAAGNLLPVWPSGLFKLRVQKVSWWSKTYPWWWRASAMCTVFAQFHL